MNQRSTINRFLIKAMILLFAGLFSGKGLDAQKFTGGLTAGMTATQVDGDTYSGYDKAGVAGGGWVNLSISDHSSIQTELKYIQKGSRHNPDSEKGDYSFLIIKLGYVEMPVLYQYRMKNGFYLETGPSMGVILHSYTEANDGTSFGIVQDNAFKLLDFSIQVGVGYYFSEKIRLGLRNANSLFSIRKERVPGDQLRIWGYGQFNNVMDLELSYRL